jgi:hypothetical protein
MVADSDRVQKTPYPHSTRMYLTTTVFLCYKTRMVLDTAPMQSPRTLTSSFVVMP